MQDRNSNKLTGVGHKPWSLWLNLTQHETPYLAKKPLMMVRIVFIRQKSLLECRYHFGVSFGDGGAWPYVVRGVKCQVDSGNGRSPNRVLKLYIPMNMCCFYDMFLFICVTYLDRVVILSQRVSALSFFRE